MTNSSNPLQIERRGPVAVVTIDYAPVNALSKRVRQALIAAIAEIAGDDAVTAAVIYGGPGRFVAGADLREMSLPPDEPFLPDVVASIDGLDKPIVAAIDGAALGGGLEIALACDRRIAGPKAQLGLPETRLGIIPGAGGTQRLPRLAGIANAIGMIGEGRILNAADAMSIGVVDEVTDGNLLDAAVEIAGRIGKRRVRELAVPAGDREAEDAAAKAALVRAKGVPAIAEVIPIIRAARDLAFTDGLALERGAFLRLRESSEAKALRHLFLAEREVWKVPGLEGVAPLDVAKVAVIGAGTMGAGIAIALADAGLDVLVLERDEAAAAAGRDRMKALYQKQVRSERITVETMAERLGRLAVGADWSVLSGPDLVIEAAFEDMTVKTEIFKRLDKLCRPGAILASNTSYLDLDQIAAVTKRPGDVVGLHFFSPANIMKLLEIVRGTKTSAVTLATALAVAKKIGKIPVVAGNCDGFIGNRIYAVYRRHAEYLIEDGASPEEVDAALESFGFAMGIFAVSDMSGLDIAYAMRKRRAATRDPGERYVAIADRLVEAGRLGRKTGAGWYAYDGTDKKSVDPVTAATIAAERAEQGIRAHQFTPEQIQRRLVAVMANEGAKVLAEGIALRASDIDLAFVNGYGFPRLKGGPMKFADEIGLQTVLTDVKTAYAVGGVGSEPAPLLVELARNGGTFATWRRN